MIRELIFQRRPEQDRSQSQESEEQFVETLNKRITKIKEWLKDNDDKPRGKPETHYLKK